jgi:hypothetical protein
LALCIQTKLKISSSKCAPRASASRQADLARLAKVQANVEAAIAERDFSWVDSDKLVRIYLNLRHEIRALGAADLAPPL